MRSSVCHQQYNSSSTARSTAWRAVFLIQQWRRMDACALLCNHASTVRTVVYCVILWAFQDDTTLHIFSLGLLRCPAAWTGGSNTHRWASKYVTVFAKQSGCVGCLVKL